MRKVFSTSVLALAFAVSAAAGAAQEPSGAKAQKDKSAAAAGAGGSQDKAQKREGGDCSPQRAGVRCSRPKPKKPWFFGK